MLQIWLELFHRFDIDEVLVNIHAHAEMVRDFLRKYQNGTKVHVAEDGIVREFIEKPTHPSSNLAFAGLLISTPALLDAIPRKQPVDIGFDVLPQLVGKMLAYPISDYLIDIGTMDNYQRAQATWPGL